MGTLEIVSAFALILFAVVIIIMVMMQEAKGDGLAGAISGSEMMYGSRGNSANDKLANITKYAMAALFIVTIAVNVIIAFAK